MGGRILRHRPPPETHTRRLPLHADCFVTSDEGSYEPLPALPGRPKTRRVEGRGRSSTLRPSKAEKGQVRRDGDDPKRCGRHADEPGRGSLSRPRNRTRRLGRNPASSRACVLRPLTTSTPIPRTRTEGRRDDETSNHPPPTHGPGLNGQRRQRPRGAGRGTDRAPRSRRRRRREVGEPRRRWESESADEGIKLGVLASPDFRALPGCEERDAERGNGIGPPPSHRGVEDQASEQDRRKVGAQHGLRGIGQESRAAQARRSVALGDGKCGHDHEGDCCEHDADQRRLRLGSNPTWIGGCSSAGSW
jgi:hypothetical protein